MQGSRGAEGASEKSLLELQASWLAPARCNLLRHADIARRKRVLDLGCGYGSVLPELRRRCSGTAIGLDRSLPALQSAAVPLVCGNCSHLPFLPGSFDLVFSQNVLFWLSGIERTIAAVTRLLQPGGCWVLIEPDYGGMMEYPPEIETRDIWTAAIQRAGGDPFFGRKVSALLSAAGFSTRIQLLSRLVPPVPERLKFLEALPLTEEEKERLREVSRLGSNEEERSRQVCHLPYYLVIAGYSMVE